MNTGGHRGSNDLRLPMTKGHIWARALEEGMPYQTRIARVMHKYVTGRVLEPEQRKRGA